MEDWRDLTQGVRLQIILRLVFEIVSARAQPPLHFQFLYFTGPPEYKSEEGQCCEQGAAEHVKDPYLLQTL